VPCPTVGSDSRTASRTGVDALTRPIVQPIGFEFEYCESLAKYALARAGPRPTAREAPRPLPHRQAGQAAPPRVSDQRCHRIFAFGGKRHRRALFNRCQCGLPRRAVVTQLADVAYGSIASVWRSPHYFRVAPESRHVSEGSACLKRARTRLHHPTLGSSRGWPRAQFCRRREPGGGYRLSDLMKNRRLFLLSRKRQTCHILSCGFLPCFAGFRLARKDDSYAGTLRCK
jgi:hypothetical protein